MPPNTSKHGTESAILGLGAGAVRPAQPQNDADNTFENVELVEGGTLPALSVGTAEIAALAVTEAKLAAAAVTRTKLAGAFSKFTLAAGTAAATDVAVTGMVVGDELVSVLSFATAAAIATVADRTSEYTVQAGGLDKAAGTNETNNQLLVFWNDLT